VVIAKQEANKKKFGGPARCELEPDRVMVETNRRVAPALLLAFRKQSPQVSEGDRRLRRPLLICFIAVLGLSFVPGVSLAGHLGGFAGGALMASMFI
jgi:hypothetical protein